MFLNPTPDAQQSSGALSGEKTGLHREAWERVMRRLRAELGDDVFSSWFGRLELVDLAGDVATGRAFRKAAAHDDVFDFTRLDLRARDRVLDRVTCHGRAVRVVESAAI